MPVKFVTLKSNINNWDWEAKRLFSRIQKQRKADKLNQYRGDGMNRFSEELKQIVRDTKGVWADDSKEVCLLWLGVSVVEWLPEEEVCKRGYVEYYSRPEYERCLMHMTGRPKVDRWNNNTREIRYTANGEWLSYDEDRHENVFYGQGEKMDGFCIVITREEALERERIAFGGEKKAPIKPGQSMKEAYEENFGSMASGGSIEQAEADIAGLTVVSEGSIGDIGIDQNTISIEFDGADDYLERNNDWFRNGDMPPIGEKLVVLRGKKNNLKPVKMSVLSSWSGSKKQHSRIWLTDNDSRFCTVKDGSIYPTNFNFGQMYLDAIEEDVIRDKKSELFTMIMDVMASEEYFDAEVLAGKLFDQGCRIVK